MYKHYKISTIFLFIMAISKSILLSAEPVHFQYPDHGEDYHGIQINRLTISGAPLSIGDEIGVFCDTLNNGNWDNFICVGAVAYPLSSNQLLAWKDNSVTHVIDGFLSNTQIYFKIWDQSKNEEIDIDYLEYLDIGGASSTEGVFDLHKISVINVSADIPQHFTFTETGTLTEGFELININSAFLSGISLSVGDEIGVFDDDLCVGAMRFFDDDLQQMYAWQNGYSESNPINFKYFDYSSGSVIDANVEFIEFEHWDISGLFNNEGFWQCSAPEFVNQQICEEHNQDWFWSPTECGVNLTAEISGISQDIYLTSGWNIMSFYNEPSDMNLQTIVQSLIDDGTLLKVQDESGSAIEDLGFPIGWVNNIGDMEVTEGYYIKVNDNTNLSTLGQPILLPYDISLTAGWNIMGYPLTSGQDALLAVQSLIDAGTLLKVQDESGSAIEDLGFPIGWVNNIGNFEPDEGYYIKVSTDTGITLDEGTVQLTRVESYRDDPQHFTPVYEGNPYLAMNLYALSGMINGANLTAGDEIGIFDSDYCVGVGVLDGEIGDYFAMVAATDDPTTGEIDGFIPGNETTFKLWDASEGIEVTDVVATYNLGDGTFSSQGTATFDLEYSLENSYQYSINNFQLLNAYPNPFNPTTVISYSVPVKINGRLSLQIYNITGQLVEELVSGGDMQYAGYHKVVWDATGYPSGIYFAKLILENYTESKKLLLIK